MRVAIAGVPRAGKTTYTETLEAECPDDTLVCHTDSLIYLGWSGASAQVATLFSEEGPLIVEGVAVPRALRKWLAAHPDRPPVDTVMWFGDPYHELSVGQRTMGRGCLTVMYEIVDELRSRGTAVVGL